MFYKTPDSRSVFQSSQLCRVADVALGGVWAFFRFSVPHVLVDCYRPTPVHFPIYIS